MKRNCIFQYEETFNEEKEFFDKSKVCVILFYLVFFSLLLDSIKKFVQEIMWCWFGFYCFKFKNAFYIRIPFLGLERPFSIISFPSSRIPYVLIVIFCLEWPSIIVDSNVVQEILTQGDDHFWNDYCNNEILKHEDHLEVVYH